MDIYTTEDQQIEQIKRWWKQYGLTAIFALLVGLGGGFGWRYWQSRQVLRLEQASNAYTVMLNNGGEQGAAAQRQVAQLLIDRYPGTAYSTLAQLQLAKQAVLSDNLDGAKGHLQKALNEADSDTLRQITRIRLARVLLAEKHPQQTLDLLATVNDDAYQALIAEVKGDALIALNRMQDAHKAYAIALKGLQTDAIMRPILQMKYDQSQ